MSGVLSRLAVVTAAVAALMVIVPAPAQAAGSVTASEPAEGAALAAAPATVRLNFSAAPDVDQSHVSVQNAAGADLTAGALATAGDDGLQVPVALRTPGDYRIAFHVVFRDGSDVVGVRRFSFGTGRSPATLGSDALARTRQSVVDAHDHHAEWLSSTMLLLDALVLGVVVLLLVLNRPGDRAALRALRERADD